MPKKQTKTFVTMTALMKRRLTISVKPAPTKNTDLSRLMDEVQALREQVQKAEAERVLH